MLRINIIEPLNHGEVVNTLLHLLGNKCEINVYTKSSNQKFIDQSAQNINCSYYKSEHSLNFFLARNWKTLNNCDVLIFTTLPKYTQLFALRRIATKSILIVHNGNTLFDRKNNIANSKSITNSLLIRTRVFGKQIFKDPFTKVFLKKIRYISFSDESMLTYLSSKKLIPGNSQNYISIPLFYYKETQDYIPQINEINIVIPGQVNEKNRDYEFIFEMHKMIRPQETNKKINIHLLGTLNKKNWISQIEQLNRDTPNLQIVYYDEPLSQNEYDASLLIADFGILPLREKVNIGGIIEYFGKTKISGAIYDFIKRGIPFLVPSWYFEENQWFSLAEKYSGSNEFFSILNDWFEKKSYLQKRKNSIQKLHQYNLEKQREKFFKILNDM